MYYTYMYEFLQKNAASLGSVASIFNTLIVLIVAAGIFILLMLMSGKRRFQFKISVILGLVGVIVFCIPYLIFIT